MMRYVLKEAATGLIKLVPRPMATRLLQLLLRAYRLQVVALYGRGSNRIIIYPNGTFAPIINQREYGEKEVQFLRKYLTPDMTILDVGANIGVYTLLFCEYVMQGSGHVYSFEPVKDTFRHLEDNITINRIPPDRVSIHNIALNDRNGYSLINVYDQWEFSGLNTIAERDLKIWGKRLPNKKETIVCQTMDAFVVNNNIQDIHMIKIDVEGSEYAVLRGGRDTIQNRINNKLFTIMIEISDHTLMSMNARACNLIDYASQLGLKVCEYMVDRNELVLHKKKEFYVNDNLFFCSNMNELNKHLSRH